MLIRASRDGRRGMMRSFWSVGDHDWRSTPAPRRRAFISTPPRAECCAMSPVCCGWRRARWTREECSTAAFISNSKIPGRDTTARSRPRPRSRMRFCINPLASWPSQYRCCWRFFCCLRLALDCRSGPAAAAAESGPHSTGPRAARRPYRGERAALDPHTARPKPKRPRQALAAIRACIMSADTSYGAMID